MPAEMLVCPYDPAHVIIRYRMPYHLVKCKKQHTLQVQSCPFNALHVFPKSEIGQHISNCPDFQMLPKGN